MSELPEGEVAELGPGVPGRERLSALLFLIEKKLRQREHLRFRMSVILSALIAISIALLVLTGGAVQRVYFSGSEPDYGAVRWAWHWTLLVAIMPFLMTFMQYLWVTFVQMYYRSLRDVEDLLDSSDFQEFRPYIHPETLADDGSFLSVLRSLLAVDIGLTSALFALGGIACAVLPVITQAVTSVGAAVLIWRDNVALAVGVTIFYVLFFVMASMKTISLFALMRRLR